MRGWVGLGEYSGPENGDLHYAQTLILNTDIQQLSIRNQMAHFSSSLETARHRNNLNTRKHLGQPETKRRLRKKTLCNFVTHENT